VSLSVCLLTRDHEPLLPRVLGSVAGVADEVVVADTGSTDGSVRVAEEHGARVCAVLWDDDFAAAQNLAVERASFDWVLWLNPDEELLTESRDALRACLGRPDVLAFGVRVRELADAARPADFMETVQLRLFRRHPGLRYVGRLYPQFSTPPSELAVRLGMRVELSDVTIRHHAYLSTPTEDKVRWALRLLEKELRDRPGQLPYLIEYGHGLLRLKDPRGHEVLAEAAVRLFPSCNDPRPPAAKVALLLDYLMAVAPQQARTPISGEQAQELALRWFPNSPPLLWRIAHIAFQAGAFPRAAAALERLVDCGRSGVYDRSLAFDPEILGGSALLNLGACYLKTGRLDAAEGCFRLLAADPRHGTQAGQHLETVRRLRGHKG
jgi:hypothetical protein